jgi:hypothetical protein
MRKTVAGTYRQFAAARAERMRSPRRLPGHVVAQNLWTAAHDTITAYLNRANWPDGQAVPKEHFPQEIAFLFREQIELALDGHKAETFEGLVSRPTRSQVERHCAQTAAMYVLAARRNPPVVNDANPVATVLEKFGLGKHGARTARRWLKDLGTRASADLHAFLNYGFLAPDFGEDHGASAERIESALRGMLDKAGRAYKTARRQKRTE